MYRLLSQGKFKGMKAGKQWRFRKDDLVVYMERGPVALALANLSINVLDTELAFLAGELQKSGVTLTEDSAGVLPVEEEKVHLLAERMIQLVYARHGSDLHLEPVWESGKEALLFRLRVDGVLQEIRRLPSSLHQPLMLQFKTMAGMNIDERKMPQTGRIRLQFGQDQVVLRVSIVPTIYGDGLSIRTVPSHVPAMKELGLEFTPLREWVYRNRGLMLITGPTGSGKVTAMSSCICDRVNTEIKVISVEDPVEYILPGVLQLQLNGFSTADGLRAISWQDPDIILVNELREAETAGLAVQAAEMGHLVISTMHVHDAIAALYRLVDWGIKPVMLAANLIGISNQSLLRKLCDRCKQPVEDIEELFKREDSNPLISGAATFPQIYYEQIRAASARGGYTVPDDAGFYHAVGCEHCHDIGYLGRYCVLEFFEFTPETKTAFLHGASQEDLTELVIAGGMRTLFAKSVRAAVEGITTLEEVQRVLAH